MSFLCIPVDSENKLRSGVERLNQLAVVSTQLKDEETKQTAQLDQVGEFHFFAYIFNSPFHYI